MQGIRSQTTYMALMTPFSKLGKADIAQSLLDLCIKRYIRAAEAEEFVFVTDTGYTLYSVARPSAKLFAMVTDAWSQATFKNMDPRGPEKAESVLRKLIEYTESGELGRLTFGNKIYNTVINAWAKASSRPEAPHRAFDILQKMREESYVEDHVVNEKLCPDRRSY